MGRWRPGRREFVFVVMEYAEQALDQILIRRALGPDEVREILPATLDALAYLHRNQRVHSHLKPSNLLAIGDQLKLASDNIRPIGRATDGIVRISWYDPPELNERGATPAMWAANCSAANAVVSSWALRLAECSTGTRMDFMGVTSGAGTLGIASGRLLESDSADVTSHGGLAPQPIPITVPSG